MRIPWRVMRRYRTLLLGSICIFCIIYFVRMSPDIAGNTVDAERRARGKDDVPDPTSERDEYRNWRFESYKLGEFARDGPGEHGSPVRLSPEEEKRSKDLWEKEAFNYVASEKVSLERSLPDVRAPECKVITYSSESLPTASVVIIFHNEAWSVILRTAHSVVNRSPPRNLHEVLLVDDASPSGEKEKVRPELQDDLDKYVAKTWPDGVVKVVRLKERHGLIKARLAGARAATGDVVIFLDAHCESTVGWLEPILARIKEDRRAVVCPITESIDAQSLAYYGSPYVGQVGSFWWSLHFTWDAVPAHEIARRKSRVEPIRSPTMPGGLFAADRNYFFEVGGYDEGMEIWGGENLELSFRVWMCGGSVEFVPCSHVGHIFRASHPYGFPDHNRDYHGLNSKRLSDVWLDDYKELFYLYRPDLRTRDAGDISSRLALRESLKCHSFDWYLQNVIPEKFVPIRNVSAYGFMRNPEMQLCSDIMNENEFDRYTFPMYVFACQGGGSGHQIISYTGAPRYEIRREWGCLDANAPIVAKSAVVQFVTCHGFQGNQAWLHRPLSTANQPVSKELEALAPGVIIHRSSNYCLDAAGLKNGDTLRIVSCSPKSPTPTQVWEFQHYMT